MAAGHMFCFSPRALGVQAYGRTSDQGASQKGASGDKRASAKSLAVPIRRDLPLVVCQLVPVFGKVKR